MGADRDRRQTEVALDQGRRLLEAMPYRIQLRAKRSMSRSWPSGQGSTLPPLARKFQYRSKSAGSLGSMSTMPTPGLSP